MSTGGMQSPAEPGFWPGAPEAAREGGRLTQEIDQAAGRAALGEEAVELAGRARASARLYLSAKETRGGSARAGATPPRQAGPGPARVSVHLEVRGASGADLAGLGEALHRLGMGEAPPPGCHLEEVNFATGSIAVRCGGTRYLVNVYAVAGGSAVLFELIVRSDGGRAPGSPSAPRPLDPRERTLVRAAGDLLVASVTLATSGREGDRAWSGDLTL
jgi:hypothetical protein